MDQRSELEDVTGNDYSFSAEIIMVVDDVLKGCSEAIEKHTMQEMYVSRRDSNPVACKREAVQLFRN